MNIKESLDRYELYAGAAGQSHASVTHVRNCLGIFDTFLGGGTDLSSVTADDFRRFLVDLRTRPVWQGRNVGPGHRMSGTTIHTYARAIKTYFTWSLSEGIIPENPLAAVPLPRKPKTLPKVYSEDNLKAVMAAADSNEPAGAIFYLFLDTGIRLSELRAVKIGDINPHDLRLKILGKGAKERNVYYHAFTSGIIRHYIDKYRDGAGKEEPLFVAESGRPLSNSSIQHMLELLGKQAGLEERLSHKLRHTWATLSLKYGANLEYIRKILGHADIQTTSEAYLNVQDADVETAFGNFSPMANLTGTKKEPWPSPDKHEPVGERFTGHEAMKEVAMRLQGEIGVPGIENSFPNPGMKTGFWYDGGPFLDISDLRFVTLKLPIEVDVTAHSSYDFLTEHFLTSRFSATPGMISRWKSSLCQYVIKCHNLLEKVIDEIESNGVQIPERERKVQLGYLLWFAKTVCIEVVEARTGTVHDFRYEREVYMLDSRPCFATRYRGGIIYVAENDRTHEEVESLRKKLIMKFLSDPTPNSIAKQRAALQNLQREITEQIQMFVNMVKTPGRCGSCESDSA